MPADDAEPDPDGEAATAAPAAALVTRAPAVTGGEHRERSAAVAAASCPGGSVTDYIKASNTGAFDGFGSSVALSADGSTLVVGAPAESSAALGIGGDQADDSAGNAGAVYVFTRSGATWTQQAYLKASNTEADDRFGSSVTLSADGSMLVVGAPGEDSNATGINGDQLDNWMADSGAVYVFTRRSATWTQQAYVKGSTLREGSQFGNKVALSANGRFLAVAAYGMGSVYTFTRIGTTWNEQTRLDGDGFGVGLALSADGTTLAVGAPFVNGFSGEVVVFRRLVAAWHAQATLRASHADSEDYFGWHVALSGDGSTLAVSAHGEDSAATGTNGDETDNSASSSGAAYVFARSSGTWSQQAYLKAASVRPASAFGWSLAVAADGSSLAVGALSDDDLFWDSGAVYMFSRSGTAWSQREYVKASNAGGWFGYSIALSADGATRAIGAAEEASAATGVNGDQSDRSAQSAGAVYVTHP